MHRLGVVALLGVLTAGVPCGLAQSPLATIEGGADVSGQNYSWTITNRHTLPIVMVEIPHYHADTFRYPPGWTSECTNLQMAGARDLPGVCRAKVDSAQAGIAPGATETFGVRLAKSGANRRAGKITVRFSDDSELMIGGVELPSPPSRSEQYELLVGLALVFTILLAVHAWRRRRGAKAAPRSADMP